MSTVSEEVARSGRGAVDRSGEVDVISRLRRQGLLQPVKEFLGQPGKRIRAELIDICYQVGGGSGRFPEPIGEFIEQLHAGSLVIDDIEDDSATRRGRAAMHRAHGVPVAINAGNWMYFSALELLTDHPWTPDAFQEVVRSSLGVIRSCHEGQALDLAARLDEMVVSEIPEVVRAISRQKTVALTGLAAWLGAKSGGAPASDCESLFQFGMRLGIGLQMQNDLQELKRFAEHAIPSDDLCNRRVTWPWAWAAKSQKVAQVECWITALTDPSGPDVAVARTLMERIHPLAESAIRQNLQGAVDDLRQPSIKQSLRGRLSQIVSRLERCNAGH